MARLMDRERMMAESSKGWLGLMRMPPFRFSWFISALTAFTLQ
jgi:hypothetical protein